MRLTGWQLTQTKSHRLQDVIGVMVKEIHRMELRKSDLEKVKEQLMKELERSVEKRDTIAMKGRASAANTKKIGGKLTEKDLTQKSKELQQSIADTEAECFATDKRNESLDKQRVDMAERMHSISQKSSELRAEDDEARHQLHELFQSKIAQSLQAECLAQAATMLQSSKFKHDQGILGEEERIHSEQQQVLELLKSLSSQNSDFALEAETIKLHLRAVGAV
jgi:chromosome segregation ATPase